MERYYSRFERWFSDHLGGRNLIDNEMPATERLLADPARVQAVYDGVLAFNEQLRRQGVTRLLVAPIQKQYYTRERLPAFAPHVPQQSNFLALSQRLLAAPQLHMIDVKHHLDQNRNRFPLLYKQDFHWTDLTALLPPTCMYGNSFSDGMLRAGLSEHFRQFHKLSRTMPLTQVPALLHGQCRYLIVQVLDIQTKHWASLAPAP